MFPGCLQDFSRMFSGCSDGSYWPGGIWWSFQMKVWTLKIQRNPMNPNYSMIPAAAIRWSPGIRWSPAIRWSPGIQWSPAIRWSIRSMDFNNWKVYGDTSITDGLVSMRNTFHLEQGILHRRHYEFQGPSRLYHLLLMTQQWRGRSSSQDSSMQNSDATRNPLR